MAKAPTLDELQAMDDDGLRDLLGQTQALATFKEELGKIQSLSGKARKEAETRLQSALTPEISTWQIRDIRESAERAARKSQGGKEAMADTSPESII